MKKTKILFWVITGLFSAFMIGTSIPDLTMNKEGVAFMNQIGYQAYIMPFLGVAKILGCIAILVPGFPRLKEWAYAGLFFELIGATYSQLATAGFIPPISFMLLPIALLFGSYLLHHKIEGQRHSIFTGQKLNPAI